MDAFEWNKVAGAVLASLLVVFVVREVANAFYHVDELETAAYVIDVPDEPAAGGGGEEEPAPVSIAALLVDASASKGERGFSRCASCHSAEEGGPTKSGPNLWNILGREKGAVAGFGYSSAMQAAEGSWGYEELDGFLKDPKGYLPGTSMGFAGLKRDGQRADMIAYLRSLSSAPAPLPEPPAAPAG